MVNFWTSRVRQKAVWLLLPGLLIWCGSTRVWSGEEEPSTTRTAEILASAVELPPEEEGAIAAGDGSARSVGAAALSVFLATGLVIGLLLVAAWAIRRYGKRFPGMTGGRHLELVDTLGIGLKRTITLVRCGDRVLVVGQSEQGLHPLADLPAAVLASADDDASLGEDDGVAEDAPDAAVQGFRQRLQALRGTEA